MLNITQIDTDMNLNQDTQSTKPWLRIVIVAYNSSHCLQDCIDCLSRQSAPDFEVVIVDNASTDMAVDYLNLPDARFKTHKSTINLGFAGGSNLGLKGAKTDCVMSLNPDMRLKRNCLKRLKKANQTYSDASMLAPVLIRATHKKRLDGVGDVLSIYGIPWRGGYDRKLKKYGLKKNMKIFSPCGGAAIYKTDVFQFHAGFDEAFFCYLEDVDLGLRINAMGGYGVIIHNAKAFHIGGQSTEKINGFQEYYTARNNLRMIIKSAPILILPIMLFAYVAVQGWITIRNLGSEKMEHRLKGYKAAVLAIPSSIKARFKRKRYKFGSSFHVMRKLVWRRRALRNRPTQLWEFEDQTGLIDEPNRYTDNLRKKPSGSRL